MPSHARLFRRAATYYHRAAIPLDIKDTYPKAEETFSLKTKDYDEALRLLRIAAVQVDEKFEIHRRMIRGEEQEGSKELPLPSFMQEVKETAPLPILSKVRDIFTVSKSQTRSLSL